MKRRLLLFGILIVLVGCFNEEIEVPDVEDITEEVMSDDVVAPEIIIKGREVEASKGEQAKISVVYNGRPYPDCKILKNGKELARYSENYEIEYGTESGGIKVTLIIYEVESTDYGKYLFIVTNSGGSAMTTSTLVPKK